MNATQLTNVLQKVKDDSVLQETLRVTKQDWAELNLTTQETFYCTNWTQCCDDFNDQELESSNGWTRQYTDCGGTCGAISRACCG